MIFMAGAACLLPSPAFSAVVAVEFVGQFTNGNDTDGYFTADPGFDLTTEESALATPYFKGMFSYDTEAFPPDGSGFYGFDLATNWLDFSLTIAGTSYTFGSFSDGSFENIQSMFVFDDYDSLTFTLGLTSVDGANESVTLDLPGVEFLTGTDLPTDFTFQRAGTDHDTSRLVIQIPDLVNIDARFAVTCASTEQGVCVLPGGDGGGSGAVPEPATWASLSLGFGLLGACMRRRFRVGARDRHGLLARRPT